jgi:hypothetical protein
MDRDGKKPKPNRAGDAPNAQRSDTKARAREASARPEPTRVCVWGWGRGPRRAPRRPPAAKSTADSSVAGRDLSGRSAGEIVAASHHLEIAR